MAGQLGSLVVELAANTARLQSDMGRASKETRDAMQQISTEVMRQNRAMAESFSTIGKAAASVFSAMKLAATVKEATLLAARVETLGTVMKVVGNNAGYTGSEMVAFQKSVASMGITTQESMSSLVKMAGSQMDLTKATELARVAQDAAVIGGINSSEAFGRMIQGIRSGELEILKNIGINVQFEEGYKKTAAALGTTSDKLTSAQKMTSRMNEVLGYGVNISGAYEASMSTAGKQMASLARVTEEVKLQFGETFRPVFVELVKELTGSLKGLDSGFQRNADTAKSFGNDLVSTFQLVKREMLQVSGFLDKVGGTSSGVMAALFGPGMMAGNKNSTEQFNKWMEINADFKKRYEQNRRDLAAADLAMKNGNAVDPGEQAKIDARAATLEQQRIAAANAARIAREESERKTEERARAKKYNPFENDHYKLLLKQTDEYTAKVEEQAKAFYELGQEIERTGKSAAAVFNIGTMQTGDLTTKRYNATPLSKYRLRTDNQYSIPQTSIDPERLKESERKAKALMDEMKSQTFNINGEILKAQEMQLAAEYESRNSYIDKEILDNERKNAALLLSDRLYAKAKEKLTETSYTAVGVEVSSQIGQMAGMMNQANADQFAAYKAMAIGQAAIATALTISKQLAANSGLGPFAIPLAFTAGAIGAAQIAMISAQQYQARALGGPVSSGTSYLVGERGPEIFTPGASGQITSNDKLSKLGGNQPVSVTQVFQVSTGVVDTVRAEISRLMPMIRQQAVDAVTQAINGGTQLSAAVGRM